MSDSRLGTPHPVISAPHRGPLSSLFHDAADPPPAAEEVEWYATRLPRGVGRILQPMSGSGRILQPLLEAGFSVDGVDASESMLAACTARLASTGRDVQLFRQDVAVLNLPFRYGAAFISGSSFQLLTGKRAAIDSLLRIRAHLVAPGLLLLDLSIPDQADHPPGAAVIEVRHATLGDGTLLACRSERVIDTERRQVRTQSRCERRARSRIVAREDESTVMTWYDETQITTLLTDTGYCDVRIEAPATTSANARHFAVSARSAV